LIEHLVNVALICKKMDLLSSTIIRLLLVW